MTLEHLAPLPASAIATRTKMKRARFSQVGISLPSANSGTCVVMLVAVEARAHLAIENRVEQPEVDEHPGLLIDRAAHGHVARVIVRVRCGRGAEDAARCGRSLQSERQYRCEAVKRHAPRERDTTVQRPREHATCSGNSIG